MALEDCIDREKDFNNGGARYAWSVVNLAGLINVLDSLLVIRQLIFIDCTMDGVTLLKRMDEGETFKSRCGGEPLCDSIGAIHNNDKYGVTALLNSASALCQKFMAGTPVLNIKLDADQISKSLKALVYGYFKRVVCRCKLHAYVRKIYWKHREILRNIQILSCA